MPGGPDQVIGEKCSQKKDPKILVFCDASCTKLLELKSRHRLLNQAPRRRVMGLCQSHGFARFVDRCGLWFDFGFDLGFYLVKAALIGMRPILLEHTGPRLVRLLKAFAAQQGALLNAGNQGGE